ncbi:hypothetical protein YC2023_069421 [Brassica napus]
MEIPPSSEFSYQKGFSPPNSLLRELQSLVRELSKRFETKDSKNLAIPNLLESSLTDDWSSPGKEFGGERTLFGRMIEPILVWIYYQAFHRQKILISIFFSCNRQKLQPAPQTLEVVLIVVCGGCDWSERRMLHSGGETA